MNSEQMKKIGIVEVFLPIDDFPSYEVSNYGNVRNIKSGRILKPGKNKLGYLRVDLCNNGEKSSQRVHRFVIKAFENNCENKSFVDHIDNDKLNNCLFNLRYATKSENQHNRSLNTKNTSSVKGVSWRKDAKKWQAKIRLPMTNKQIHLGYFDNLEDAKIARQNEARELYGEYINKCEA